jgi:hypothetical protein
MAADLETEGTIRIDAALLAVDQQD